MNSIDEGLFQKIEILRSELNDMSTILLKSNYRNYFTVLKVSEKLDLLIVEYLKHMAKEQ